MKIIERDLAKFYAYNTSTLWNWTKKAEDGSSEHKNRREAMELYYEIKKMGLSKHDVLASADKIKEYETQINAFVDKHEQLSRLWK